MVSLWDEDLQSGRRGRGAHVSEVTGSFLLYICFSCLPDPTSLPSVSSFRLMSGRLSWRRMTGNMNGDLEVCIDDISGIMPEPRVGAMSI